MLNSQAQRQHSDRIEALRRSGLLTRSPKDEFGHLTDHVRDVLDVPVAIVTLVDEDRQVFAGHSGLPEPWGERGETPMTHSFCQHVVERRQPLNVCDARLDPLVRDNHAIFDIGVVAYLGVPLALPDGEVVGALAAIDSTPRVWTQADERRLRVIARTVENEMAVRISESRWRSLFERLQEGFVQGRVVRDGTGRIVDWRYEEVNPAWHALVGLPQGSVVGRTLREVIPDIEDAWIDEFAQVVETGEPIRFTRQVGSLDRWYDGVAQPIGSDRFTVIFMEVTDRVRADRRREALKQIGDALLLLDEPDALSRAANEVIGRTLGVGRVGYGTVLEDGETFVVPNDWTADGYPSLAGTYRMDDYGGYAEDLRQGRTVAIPDIRLDPRTVGDTTPLERVAVRSLVNIPIVERGRTVAVLYVNADAPRHWSDADVEFLNEASIRIRSAVERRRTVEALAESRIVLAAGEAKWRGVFETLAEGFSLGTVIRDASGRIIDWRYDELNSAWGRLVGVDAADMIGRTIREAFPGIEEEWVEGLADVVDTGKAKAFTGRVGVLGRFYEGVAQPSGGDTFTTIFMDVTERVGHERRQGALMRLGDALRVLDDRHAIAHAAAECLASALNASRTGFAVFDPADDTVEMLTDWCAPGIASIVGRHRLRDYGDYVDALKAGKTVAVADVRTDDRTAVGVKALKALRIGAFLNMPVIDHGIFTSLVSVTQDRPHSWSHEELDFVRQVGDRTQAAIARLAADEQSAVLNAELAHRMKNTLAMVQAIVTQTLRQAATMEEGRNAIASRLSALARAQNILTRSDFAEADVREVVEAAIGPHQTAGGRVSWSGPRMGLTGQQALGLSLAVHELATNAAKYGALSNDAGRIAMSWGLGDGAFEFRWIETGGPPVAHPESRGFGSRLIERIVGSYFDGESRIDFDPAGVRFTLRGAVPLTSSAS